MSITGTADMTDVARLINPPFYAPAAQTRGRRESGRDFSRGRIVRGKHSRGCGGTGGSRTKDSVTNVPRLCFVCGDLDHLANVNSRKKVRGN